MLSHAGGESRSLRLRTHIPCCHVRLNGHVLVVTSARAKQHHNKSDYKIHLCSRLLCGRLRLLSLLRFGVLFCDLLLWFDRRRRWFGSALERNQTAGHKTISPRSVGACKGHYDVPLAALVRSNIDRLRLYANSANDLAFGHIKTNPASWRSYWLRGRQRWIGSGITSGWREHWRWRRWGRTPAMSTGIHEIVRGGWADRLGLGISVPVAKLERAKIHARAVEIRPFRHRERACRQRGCHHRNQRQTSNIFQACHCQEHAQAFRLVTSSQRRDHLKLRVKTLICVMIMAAATTPSIPALAPPAGR
jgi:hypothetical protein